MFCPKCGSKNSIEQKFCRTCGLGLEGSALSLREQLPEITNSELERQEHNLERFGRVALTGFCIAAALGVLGVCYVILSKMILSGKQPLAGIFFLGFVIFGALGLTFVIWSEILKEKRKKAGFAPELLVEAPSPVSLPDGGDFRPIPSVVEDTTELLTLNNTTKNLD